MIALFAGLGAALAWGISSLSLSRASKLIGGPAASAWVLTIGLVVITPVVVVVPPGEDIDADRWLWVAVASVGSAVGVTLLVTALRDGKVGVVMPIVSTQGALAGLVAVAAGASLSPATAFLMLLMTAAVAVVSRGPATATGGRPEHTRRAIALAILAALILAVALYAAGRAAGQISPFWIAFASRAVGALVVAAPLALRRALPRPGLALPFVLFSGVAELTGYCLAAWAAGDDVAIAGVVAAQFATVAAVGGWIVFGERLTRVQIAAVAVIVASVCALAVTQA